MKLTHYALLAAAAACGLANAQQTAYTTPVGYETVTFEAGKFNLTGVRLFKPQVAAGTFESNTASTLVDTQATFNLVAGTNYVVEFPNGAVITALGSDFSGTTLSGLSGITASYLGNYVIREALTIASVFGTTNQGGLAPSDTATPTDADLVWLPDGQGNFTRVFYSTFLDPENDPNQDFFGWIDADTFAKAANQVIDPTRGLFVQTAKSVAPINLVVTGEVKKTQTAFVATDSYSLLGGVFPAGATLTTSNLKDYVLGTATATPTEADLVLLPDGSGNFVRAFYSTFIDAENDPNQDFFGWLSADDFSKIPNQAITPGFYIQKIGPNINGLNTPPSFYNNL